MVYNGKNGESSVLIAQAQKQAAEGYCVQAVKPAQLPLVWKHIVPLLEDEPEIWNKGHTLQSLSFLCECDVFKLWLVVKEELIQMAFMTTFTEFPATKTCDIVWAKGKIHTLENFLPLVLSAVEHFGQSHGCAYTTIRGRIGWKPIIAPFGYTIDQTIFVKKIVDQNIH